MKPRWLPGLLVVPVLLLAGSPESAWGQTKPLPGLEKLSPEERRGRVLQRHRQWETMSPDERERIMKNYERWRSMTPEERAQARERWRQMPPEERERLREQWRRATPEERERLRQQHRGAHPPQGQERPR